MAFKGRIGKRRPDHGLPGEKAGDVHPVGRRWGRPGLPRHWTPRWDADEIVRQREELEIIEELEQYTIIW